MLGSCSCWFVEFKHRLKSSIGKINAYFTMVFYRSICCRSFLTNWIKGTREFQFLTLRLPVSTGQRLNLSRYFTPKSSCWTHRKMFYNEFIRSGKSQELFNEIFSKKITEVNSSVSVRTTIPHTEASHDKVIIFFKPNNNSLLFLEK